MRMQQAGQDAAALGGQIDPEMNPLGPNGEPLYARPTREQDTRDLHDRRGGGPRGGGRGGAEHQPGRAGGDPRDHPHDRNNTMMRGSGGQQQYNQNVEQTTGRAARGDREQNYRDHEVEHQQPPRQRGSRGAVDHTYDQTGAAGPSTRGDGHRRGHQMREDDRRQHNMRDDTRGSRGGVDQHGRSYNSGDPRSREQGQHSNRPPPDEYDYDYDHRIRMEQEHDRNMRRREQRDRDHRGGPDHGGQHATRGEQQGMNMGEHQQQRRGDQNHRERRRADRDQHGRGGGDQNISNRERVGGQQPPPMYNDPRAAGGSRGGPDRGMDHAREQLQRRGDHVDHHRDRENHPSTTSRSGGPPGYGVIGDNVSYQEQQTTGTTRGQRGSNRDRGGGATNDPRGEVGRRSDPRIQAATSQEMMRQSGGGDQAGLYNQVGAGGPPPPEQSSHRRGDRADRRENTNRGDRGNDRRHHNRGGGDRGDRGGNNDRGQPFDWTPPVRPANEVQ